MRKLEASHIKESVVKHLSISVPQDTLKATGLFPSPQFAHNHLYTL